MTTATMLIVLALYAAYFAMLAAVFAWLRDEYRSAARNRAARERIRVRFTHVHTSLSVPAARRQTARR